MIAFLIWSFSCDSCACCRQRGDEGHHPALGIEQGPLENADFAQDQIIVPMVHYSYLLRRLCCDCLVKLRSN